MSRSSLPVLWAVPILTVAIAVVMASAAFLTIVGATGARQDQETGTTFEVLVIDFAFEPSTVTVAAGSTVTWTNTGSRPHTVTADDGSFDSGRLDPAEQFSQVFDESGTFTYFCGFHPDMQGSIIVTEQQTEVTGTPQAEADPADAGTPVTRATEAAELTSASDVAGPVRNLESIEQSRLAHIHAGTCEELGIVVYSFPDIRTFRADNGDDAELGAIELITGTTQVPLSDLFGEPFSVHVHESTQNKQTYIACSDIGSRPNAPWSEAEGLTLQATEQNGSGYTGFTTLRPSPDGGTQVSIALAASSAATEAAAAQPELPPSSTYISPTYDYTIGYGPTWEEAENTTANSRDRLVLFNGTSYITFTGVQEFGGDPQACVDSFVAQLTADPNVDNLALAADEEGNPLSGGTEATGAYAVYSHDYTFPDRTEPYTLFVGCVPLVPNEAVLAIVQNVPTAEYGNQVELREALLRGLTLAQ